MLQEGENAQMRKLSIVIVLFCLLFVTVLVCLSQRSLFTVLFNIIKPKNSYATVKSRKRNYYFHTALFIHSATIALEL